MNKNYNLRCFWDTETRSSKQNPLTKLSCEGYTKIFCLKRLLLIPLLSLFTFFSANAQPNVAAPDPICDPGDVISMFSNEYVDVPVDTWLTPWSCCGATVTDIQISGNDTKHYQNVGFVGIETVGPNLIDATGMSNFHIDVWTPNMTVFRVKLVDFGPDGNFGGGDDSEHEITFNNPTQNVWLSLDIPLSDFTGLASTEHLAQLIFSGDPFGAGVFYLDNVYFSNDGCPTQAPSPTCPEADVISMFSNEYMDVPVDTWLTPWSCCGATVTDLQISGNDTKYYENVGFVGIETVGPNVIDASGMDYFNIDIRTSNMTVLRIKLVDFGPDGNFGGGDDSEHEVTFNNPAQNEWVTYQLSLADLTGLASTEHMAQLILSGEPFGAGTFYVDNVYYSNCVNPVDIEFCVDLNCFPNAPQVPSVAGTFTTPPWNFGQYFLSDPDSDGFWCTTISLLPGSYEYKFFDQIEGQEDLTPGGPCTVTTGPFTNRQIVVQAGPPQTVSFGWETCDPTCIPPLPPPDLPITFDDSGINYNLVNFGGMNSFLGVDPTNSANMVMCSNKTPGAQCWAGTVVGNAGLQNPIPFSPTSMLMTMDVYSPNVGTPILLKVEGTGAPSEVLVFTTVANAWETLVFDFATGFPAPPNLGATYDKVVVFAEFTCSTTGSLGSGLTYYFDNIMMCELPLQDITCPDDLSLACDDQVPAAATDEASFLAIGGTIDNPCFAPITVTANDVETGEICSGITITRTYTVTDGVVTLTCDQIITKAPPGSPTIVCPSDMTVECIEDVDINFDDAMVVTDCDLGFTGYVTQPDVIGAPNCPGTTYTYTYKAIDDCGNTASCFQIFTIENDPPTIEVIPGGTVECFEDIVTDPSDATVTTACGEDYELKILPPIVDGAHNCPTTTYTFPYRVRDNCGREVIANRVFTIDNSIMPTIVAPPDMTISCDYNANLNPDYAEVTTGCSVGYNTVVTGPTISGLPNCDGTTYTYTYTVTDDCGRSASDTRTFTLNNGHPEFLNCPSVPLQLNCEDEGWEDVIQAWLASVQAESSCSEALTVTNDYNPFSQGLCVNNGPKTVRWFATDDCGRTSMCVGTIIVYDTEGPVFTTPPQDELVVCNYITQDLLDAWVDANGNAEVEDCWASIGWSTVPPNPTINCEGNAGPTSVEVEFIARDGCGNKSSMTATFTALPAMNGMDGSNEQSSGSLKLFQNQPNPFKASTTIGFYLPEAERVTLSIYDLSGKVIKVVQGDYSEGYNEIQISRSELSSAGMMFYELKTANETDIKKMYSY